MQQEFPGNIRAFNQETLVVFHIQKVKPQQLALSPRHRYTQIYELPFHPCTPLTDTSLGYIAVWYIHRNTFHEVLLISHGGSLGTVNPLSPSVYSETPLI